MRIVVTGSRAHDNPQLIRAVLDKVRAKYPAMELAHGRCPTGADAVADAWAVENDVCVSRYKAAWDKHGPSAGPKRNQSMLEHFKPDVVIAFKGGKGTEDCVRRAVEAGVQVWRAEP